MTLRTALRRWTTGIATALLAATVTAPIAAAGSSPASTATPVSRLSSVSVNSAAAAASTSPLSALNGCLVARKAGDVLILLDKSGSVGGTDKAGARIDAAEALLDRLTQRINDPNSEMHGAKLSTTVVTFGDAVYQGADRVAPDKVVWTDLSSGTLPGLQNQVEQLRKNTNGVETNYWAALDWVASATEAHTQGPVADACHLVFWFSDGAPALIPRTSDFPDGTRIRTPWTPSGYTEAGTKEEVNAVLAEQIKDIKRPGGLADRLRADGVVLVAIGLANGIPVSQLDIMRCIAENSGAQCGSLPGIGKFFQVTQADQLLLYIEGLGDSSTFLPPDERPVCAINPCAEQHTFKLDSSIKNVRIVGVPSIAGVSVQLKAPDGTTADIPAVAAGSKTDRTAGRIGAVGFTYQWASDRDLTVDMVRPQGAAGWTGTWSAVFIASSGSDPKAVAAMRVGLSADLALTAPNPPTSAQAGEVLNLPLELTSFSGRKADVGSPPPTMTGTVTLTPPTGAAVPVATGSVDKLTSAGGVKWNVPQASALGPVKIQVQLDVTTVTGIKLDPVIRQFDLTLTAGVGAPQVVSTSIDFGSVEGTDPGSASLTVVGPGCVWVSSGDLVAHPESVPGVTIGGEADSQVHCVHLTEGQRRDINVTATPEAAGNGTVRGQLIVHLAREGHPEDSATQAVAYRMDLVRKASPIKWLFFGLALLIGIGLPVLVLWLSRRIAARFPNDVSLSAVRIPVLVGPHGVIGMNGSPPEVPGYWRSLPPPTDGRRGLQIEEGVKVRARTGPLWSASPGYSEVSDRPGTAGVPPFYGGKAFTARMPLALQGSYAFLFRTLEDLGGPAEQLAGELVMITHPSTDAAARRNLLGEALSQGPGLVNDLREAVRAQTGAGQPGASGGDDSGGGGAPGAAGSSGPAPVPPGGPGQGWGGSRASSPGQQPPAPVPGWGGQPAGPQQQAAPAPAPGWGAQPAGRQQQAPPAPGWATQPAGPRQQPAPAPGWGGQPAGPQQQAAPAPAPGWGAQQTDPHQQSAAAPTPGWNSGPAVGPDDSGGQPGWGSQHAPGWPPR